MTASISPRIRATSCSPISWISSGVKSGGSKVLCEAAVDLLAPRQGANAWWSGGRQVILLKEGQQLLQCRIDLLSDDGGGGRGESLARVLSVERFQAYPQTL